MCVCFFQVYHPFFFNLISFYSKQNMLLIETRDTRPHHFTARTQSQGTWLPWIRGSHAWISCSPEAAEDAWTKKITTAILIC